MSFQNVLWNLSTGCFPGVLSGWGDEPHWPPRTTVGSEGLDPCQVGTSVWCCLKCGLSTCKTRLTSSCCTWESLLCSSLLSSLPPCPIPILKTHLIHVLKHVFAHDSLLLLFMNMNDFIVVFGETCYCCVLGAFAFCSVLQVFNVLR